jgi:uncharacterized protein with HEPN domain
MPKRDVRITLRQMRDHAAEAVELVRKAKRSDLDSDRKLNLALVRLLEIVGEAANRVPVRERSNHPLIPWVQIIGVRNRLIHAYDNFDLDIVWKIVAEDLPNLVDEVDNILKAIGPASSSDL